MRKVTFIRLLMITAIVLVAGVTVGGWVTATHPTSHPLRQTHPAAGPRVQENIYFGSSQVVYKLNGRDGSVIWKQALTRSIPLDRRAASHFGVHVVDGVIYASWTMISTPSMPAAAKRSGTSVLFPLAP